MSKLKLPILLLSLSISVAVGLAANISVIQNEQVPITNKTGAQHSNYDRSGSINVSINGHTWGVVFTENLGQVTIRIFNENGTPIDLMTTPTPNGQIIYIPLAGRYTVLFTLPNGDEYWGEFEVED